MTVLRIAGAQIPCTDKLEKNIKNIKDAISWASKNSVDFLLTPEGSLSGYYPGWDTDKSFDDIVVAEKEIVKFATDNNISLCLGTMWKEPDEVFPGGYRNENQIRFYSKKGKLLGKTNKLYTIPEYDRTVPGPDVQNVLLEKDGNFFNAIGLICNDFWGGPLRQQMSLPLYAYEKLSSQMIFHATNGFRGMLPNYDEITDSWHEGNLRMISFSAGIPIITVDNSCMMHGSEYEGKTSSQSGILLNGMWLVKAPRTGTQYFYHDFNYEEVTSRSLYRHPDQDIIDLDPNIRGSF